MSITLSLSMLYKLSPQCHQEILNILQDTWSPPSIEDDDFSVTPAKEKFDVTHLSASPFESAALSFSGPLTLPSAAQPQVIAQPQVAVTTSSNGPCPHILALASCSCPLPRQSLPVAPAERKVRYAMKTSHANYSDLYTIKTASEIDEITREIDEGYFVGPDSWLKGRKHHPENYDVRKVRQVLTKSVSINSYGINMQLMSMDRNRISAILRQLKIQGIIAAHPKV